MLVQRRIADFVIKRFPSDSSFASVLAFLDFSKFSRSLIESLIKTVCLTAAIMGGSNGHTIIKPLADFMRKNPDEIEALLHADSAQAAKIAEEAYHLVEAAQMEQAELREEIKQLKALMAVMVSANSSLPTGEIQLPEHHPCCQNIIEKYADYCEVSSCPAYEEAKLRMLLTRKESDVNCQGKWASDPHDDGLPEIRIAFRKGILLFLDHYQLKSCLQQGRRRSPYLRNWELFGHSGKGWFLLNSVSDSKMLSNGQWNKFDVSGWGRLPIDGIRLCQTGCNGAGNRHLHIEGFILAGDVVGPPEIVKPIMSRSGFVEGAIPSVSPKLAISPSVVPDVVMASVVFPKFAISPSVVPDVVMASVVFPLAISPAVVEERATPDEAVQGCSELQPLDLSVDEHAESQPVVASEVEKDTRNASGQSVDFSEDEQSTDDGRQTPMNPDQEAVVNISDKGLLPARRAPSNGPLLRDRTDLEVVRTLFSSRFGSTKHLRRRTPEGGYEELVGKFYNVGDTPEDLAAFWSDIDRFLSLSHRHVMRIVGLIAPTTTSGPIVLTEYRKDGSLLDVLTRVKRNDPPDFWNETGKVRMILSLVSGLQYLHSQDIVHRELKPSDLIVSEDGSIEISDYLTSFFQTQKYTQAPRVGALSYVAPEIYKDQSQMHPNRAPADVFSFASILFEHLFKSQVFQANQSAAGVIRKGTGSNEGQSEPGERPLMNIFPNQEFQKKKSAFVTFNFFYKFWLCERFSH
jgi:hypothetical protein